MNKLAMVGLLAAGLALQATASHAGTNYADNIVVSGQYAAYGALRAARNSADNNQFIGCAVFGNTTSSTTTYVACSARDANGNSFYCSKYNPSYVLVQAAMAISASSSLIVQGDGAGTCTYIYVSNHSVNL
jgi:hypothetical protein